MTMSGFFVLISGELFPLNVFLFFFFFLQVFFLIPKFIKKKKKSQNDVALA